MVGTPIEAKHANPKLKRWGWRISDSLRRFFADFDRFGVIVNGWAAVKDSADDKAASSTNGKQR